MYSTNRTSEQFFEAKAKGQKAEKTFMEMIALMGGTASSLGTVPTRTDPTPRFTRPHASNENGFCYSVSPDILFTLPDQPKGFASLAQVKIKKVQRETSKNWLYVYLDEAELHRMNIASQFYDVFFVIHVPELTDIKGFHDWMWVSVDNLKETITPMIKRKIRGKPTFLLPLNNFKPLSEITRKRINDASNSNFDPTLK